MRLINMTVVGDTVYKDSTIAGVQGSGNADTVRMVFDDGWDTLAKTMKWVDAHGKAASERLLTADLLEDAAKSPRIYLAPVPPEALMYAGTCTLIIDGAITGKRGRTAMVEMEVLATHEAFLSGTATDVVTPSQIEQIQQEMDAVLEELHTVASGEDERKTAEAERIAAEEERVKAETERVSAESDRKTAEATRKTNETSRKNAERERASAEAGRVAAEAGRVAAEAGRVVAEAARKEAELSREDAERRREEAERQRQSAVGEQVKRATAAAQEAGQYAEQSKRDAEEVAANRQATETFKADVERVQAAIHARRRVLCGTATDAERLLPGDTLIITDDSSVEHTVDYYDLLQEARKAAAGQPDDLAALAVLSVVNATNLRRDKDGNLWTTDTITDFCTKLTAFAAAAMAAGYSTASGECVATWAQAQAWMIDGVLLSPIAAEARDYYWRKVAPKTEYDAIKERIGSIEAQLKQSSDVTNTLINGGALK